MSICNPPEITDVPTGVGSVDYTRVSFLPDFPRFGVKKLTKDIASLFYRRVVDVAGCNPGLKVFINGKQVNVASFDDLVHMYTPASRGKAHCFRPHKRWMVGVSACDEGSMQQHSYVNSIWTSKGGTHVNAVVDSLVKGVVAAANKQLGKDGTATPALVKQHLCVHVCAQIENPEFDSQTKDTLVSSRADWGSDFSLSAGRLRSILSETALLDRVVSAAKVKSMDAIGRSGRSVRTSQRGSRLLIPKLEDASRAGTKDWKDCTLILTEGDSAKALAVAGLSVVGRDHFGVFPLRGKLLNVRDASGAQLRDNAEFNAIKSILGLRQPDLHGAKPVLAADSVLRYGNVMLMTDQDEDGSHIKGLFINMVNMFWPSLLKTGSFVQSFSTPIVKAFNGREVREFFSMPEFREWEKDVGEGRGRWRIKYYKGLGTSTSEEGRQYFRDVEKHR